MQYEYVYDPFRLPTPLVYVADPRHPNKWRLVHMPIPRPRTWAEFRRRCKWKREQREKSRHYSY